jgi:hypothetical protein
MDRRRSPLLLLIALSAGCVSMPDVSVDQAQVDEVLDTAARQVRRCYRAPRVSSEGRLIATRVRVRFSPEGELIGLPVLVHQTGVTPRNQAQAGPMAEAAIAAVIRCTPITLPPGLYVHGWREFDLTFSPVRTA